MVQFYAHAQRGCLKLLKCIVFWPFFGRSFALLKHYLGVSFRFEKNSYIRAVSHVIVFLRSSSTQFSLTMSSYVTFLMRVCFGWYVVKCGVHRVHVFLIICFSMKMVQTFPELMSNMYASYSAVKRLALATAFFTVMTSFLLSVVNIRR